MQGKLGLIPWIIMVGALLAACSPAVDLDTISGTVFEDTLSLKGAVVRVQTTAIKTVTDGEGNFTLTGISSEVPLTITAWASGYYIAGVDNILPGTSGVEIHLKPHSQSDNSDYSWLPSQYHPGQGEDQGCAACHSNPDPAGGANSIGSLPVDDWLLDAHSRSAANPRFLTMYLGTDQQGNQSPPTRFAYNRDYGSFPLQPDPEQPYYGPGYKLDFPETSGNCSACHVPAASVDDPYRVDPTSVTSLPEEGIPCDFCHKIWDVRLNPITDLPYPNMPGVLSLAFRRPPEGHQLFVGPYDDVAPGEDTYSPLQTQSQICAACHYGVFWDTIIYNSFGEWLESPYNDPVIGQTCQDCHMPPSGTTRFAVPEAGGLERSPETIFSHRMPGGFDEDLLQNAVSMTVDAWREGEQVIVEVSISNDKTGHDVPTDSPLRQLILLVQAQDPAGKPQQLKAGPTVPEWGGVGDPAAGYYAGLTGKGYAKILKEVWTGVSPTGAYWNPTKIVSDNRLGAFETDMSRYVFASPENSPTSLSIILIYRRAYITLMDQKSWAVPDIIMEKETLTVP